MKIKKDKKQQNKTKQKLPNFFFYNRIYLCQKNIKRIKNKIMIIKIKAQNIHYDKKHNNN
jgi:hypothetical protein